MLFILNRQDEVVGLLKNGGINSATPPFFDDLLTEDLATGAETFQFTTIMDENGVASNLVVGNYIAFQKDDKYRLFQIMQTTEDHQEAMYITVYCECAGLELINSVVRQRKMTSTTLRRFMTTVLEDTSWNVGKLPLHEESLDIELENQSVYSALQNNISKFGVEIEFRVSIKSGKLVTKYVDVYETRGRVTGKRFEFGRDIEGIQRKTDLTNVYTALIGRGTNDISFRDIEVSGIDKPKGQDYVVNEEAFNRYNNNGYHIMGIFEYDTESPEELLRQTYKQLKECNEPNLEYEVNVALLGHLLDEDWNRVSIGDTVCIVDNYFNPPIHLMARVNKLESSMTNPQADTCVLSNFTRVTSNITDEMRRMASKLEGYVDNSLGAKFPIGEDDIKDGAIKSTHIYENSITADKINAGEIKSYHIETGTLDAQVINAESVTAQLIEGVVVEALNLYAQNADIGKATIDSALIDKAEITEIVSKNLTVGNAQITDLEAEKIKTGNLIADVMTANAIKAINMDVTEATIKSAKIGELTAEHIKSSVIEAINLYAQNVEIGSAVIDSAVIGDISADKITTGELSTDILKSNIIEAINLSVEEAIIDSAKIGDISADKITSGEISTDVLKSNVITAINASLGTISADRIDVSSLVVNEIDASKITSGSIDADRLSANVISAINAHVGDLKIKQGQMETIKVGSANITDIDVSRIDVSGKLNAKNIDVDSITITDANIQNLDASKIKSGSLDTSKVSINSTSGNLTIEDNTIQIKDNQEQQKVRVQIGQDSRGEYGILVFNSNGEAIFDSDRGILSENGLNDDIISNEKIKEGSVDSRVLNLEELFVSDSAFINKISTVSIDANQIRTGLISGERIDMKGLVSFETFDESIKDLLFPIVREDEDGTKHYDKTYINGGNLATGSIKADKIDLLSGLNVKGPDGLTTFSISDEGQVTVNGILQSGNFKTGETGYSITTDGNVELNQAKIRGDVILPNAGVTNSNIIEIGTDEEEIVNTNPVRFWAGSSFDNRDLAPFRVHQDGSLYAKDGTFSGNLYGSYNNDRIHLHDNEIVINSISTVLNDSGEEINLLSRHYNPNPYIRFGEGTSLINTDLIFGTVENPRIQYLNEDEKLNINICTNFSNEKGSMNLNLLHGNQYYAMILNNTSGGKHEMKYIDNKNGLVFNSSGSNDYDFRFERMDNSEDVKVQVRGDLEVKESITSDKHSIELRSVEGEGWGFYTV